MAALSPRVSQGSTMATATMMRTIHHVVTRYKDRWVADPELGMVKRHEQIMDRSGVDMLVHQGVTYEIQPDGTFLLPDDVAQFFLNQPNWFEGANPFGPEEPTPMPEEFRAPRRDPMAAAHAAAAAAREAKKAVTRVE
jgi:hypothetical protein